jgi:catechol 2,3-dioxygenase-like lactoylglutathione lyase family enzyme
MIDHVGLGVRELERSKAFYQQALGPLGYTLLSERGGSAGFGVNGKPDFWIHANRPVSGPMHVAVASPDHESYYSAFVLDPDGNNIEAVCHLPA